MAARPLGERKLDYFFVVIFFLFACSSFLVDMMGALHELFLHDEGEWIMKRLLLDTYADCDPLFIIEPPFLRMAVTISAFVWGPLYVFFVWGFVKGKAVIRIPALMYSSALTCIMLMIFSEELFSQVPGWASPLPWKFAAYNLPYLLVPILVGIRMARPDPFGEAPRATAQAMPGVAREEAARHGE
jgi:hypothetical protein